MDIYSKDALAHEDATVVVREIKRSFRSMMNGVVATSLRDKGIRYKINWGAQLPQLAELAQRYPQRHDVACLLWENDIRECKIMASFLMPPGEMTHAEADTWVHDIRTVELAEICTHNLFRYLPMAPRLASIWLQGEPIQQLCAYHILSFIISCPQPDCDCGLPEEDRMIPCLVYALTHTDASLRHAAYNFMMRYLSVYKNAYNRIKTALDAVNLDIL